MSIPLPDLLLAGVNNSTGTNVTSQNTSVLCPAGHRLFLSVMHTGGDITNISGGGTVFADWTLHEMVYMDEETSLWRISVYSCKPTANISGNISVAQSAGGRLVTTFIQGLYDVDDSGSASIGASTAPGPWEVSVDLPPPLASLGEGRRTMFLLCAGAGPAFSGSASSWTVGVPVDDLTPRNGVNGRTYHAAIRRAEGEDIPPSTLFSYYVNSSGTNSTLMGMALLRLAPMYGLIDDTFVIKSQSYSTIALDDDAGMSIKKSMSYIARDGEGLTIPKVISYSAPPPDPLNQLVMPSLVPYAVVGILPDDIQLMSAMKPYVVTGMDITRLPQDMEKFVAYAVTMYDVSGRLFQHPDTALGPEPARWRLDDQFPYIAINDGVFSLYAPVSGLHTLFAMRRDGSMFSLSLELEMFIRVDLPLTEDFSQVALIAAAHSDVLEESVRKQMLLRRKPSLTWS